MKTCEDHSDCVVVFSSRYCPMCELEKEKTSVEKRLDSATDEIATLNETVADLRESS